MRCIILLLVIATAVSASGSRRRRLPSRRADRRDDFKVNRFTGKMVYRGDKKSNWLNDHRMSNGGTDARLPPKTKLVYVGPKKSNWFNDFRRKHGKDDARMDQDAIDNNEYFVATDEFGSIRRKIAPKLPRGPRIARKPTVNEPQSPTPLLPEFDLVESVYDRSGNRRPRNRRVRSAPPAGNDTICVKCHGTGRKNGKKPCTHCLPKGWEAKRDNKGFTYYVNHGAKKTQWERPPSNSKTGSTGVCPGVEKRCKNGCDWKRRGNKDRRRRLAARLSESEDRFRD